MRGRVLIVAGSDSGGGAGIQADIKSVTAMGGYAATAVTALTAQDTEAVRAVHPVPLDFVRLQIRMSLADIGADAIKTGMLGERDTIEAVWEVVSGYARGIPLVVDPVMVAKGGSRLLEEDAVAAMRERLLPLATLVTPNIPEAEVLVGFPIPDLDAMRRAAAALRGMGAGAALVKGGHMAGDALHDVLLSDAGEEVFTSSRIETRHTHGTGCTLASAIAAGLAQGMAMRDAVARARDYVAAAIRSAPGYGRGHGPLDHAVTVDTGRLGW
ncbi:bifunctional hydroxymethylpyrimidine kinase/phosphomethylpyrimidine kinase [Roseomonas sp. CCTCC AB2023176]|uniref:bifunctional hydroxymethylpyrimidine kinase/phosphomethylpyrimidine kinase n=1 Tax=Roseomonas sp. CCTCC AB2023176 TaxID=3342640 RepID=UPI0035DDA308